LKWSILILTQPSRADFLSRLREVLDPQLVSGVELRIKIHDRNFSVGESRYQMLQEAHGEYVSFIDDDDLVPADYVSSILPLLSDVDYIGFNLQLFIDGQKQKPTYHSLKYKEWFEDEDGFYRDISHLNPIKREIAVQVPMTGNLGEDSRWAEALRTKQLVKTEKYIDDAMYFYYWRSNKKDGV
jgi:glycosyltransferase involved in cell wall biosynthesis